MNTVEVLMSTYNGEKYLEEQLESIFKQKNCKIHVLVRDDGSTDRTVEILEIYKKTHNLDYYSGNNLGAAKSFIHLVYHCGEADYYAFADQDDIWLSDKIEKAIACIYEHEENNKLPMAYCSNLTPMREQDDIIKKALLNENIATEYTEILSRCSDVFGCTMVWNKNLQRLLNMVQPVEKLAMHDYWLALVASCYGMVIYDSRPSILYRQHANNQVGAGISSMANWRGRLSWIFKKTKFSVADTAKEMLKIMNLLEVQCPEEYNRYTQIVASYKDSLGDKITYLKTANMKSMSFKQKCFHVLLTMVESL